MVQLFRPQPSMVAAGKDQAQEIDGPVGTEGEMCVIDDEQGRGRGRGKV